MHIEGKWINRDGWKIDDNWMPKYYNPCSEMEKRVFKCCIQISGFNSHFKIN